MPLPLCHVTSQVWENLDSLEPLKNYSQCVDKVNQSCRFVHLIVLSNSWSTFWNHLRVCIISLIFIFSLSSFSRTCVHTPHTYYIHYGEYIYRTKHCKFLRAMTLKTRQDPQSLKKMQLSLLQCNLLGLQFRGKHFWNYSQKRKLKPKIVFFLTLAEPEPSLPKKANHSIFSWCEFVFT